jgi:hypothetical protein
VLAIPSALPIATQTQQLVASLPPQASQQQYPKIYSALVQELVLALPAVNAGSSLVKRILQATPSQILAHQSLL